MLRHEHRAPSSPCDHPVMPRSVPLLSSNALARTCGGAAALAALDAVAQVTGPIERGAAALDTVRGDIDRLPGILQVTEVLPAADLIFGSGMLILIILLHAAGVRMLTSHVTARVRSILARPTLWRADLLMSSTVFLLLALHMLELFVWAASLVYTNVVPNWRTAGFFAGNTYTTLGYGAFVLPPAWEMLAPIMAISGLFTFGWSGSVLVDYVRRCHLIRDAAAGIALPATASPAPGQTASNA
jgi:hypothetical protein